LKTKSHVSLEHGACRLATSHRADALFPVHSEQSQNAKAQRAQIWNEGSPP